MDARRIGYESSLTAALLERATPGYLTPEQRAATAGWLTAALKVATQEIHGVRALIPVRTDETIDEADGYLLHDFLAQHAIDDRRRELIPASLWDAVTGCVAEPYDLRRVGENADVRALVVYAVPIYRILAGAGDQNAVFWLSWLTKLGDLVGDDMEVWRARTNAGDAFAVARLGKLLAERDDRVGVVEMWRARADAGDRDAARRLAELLAEQGDGESLRRELYAGNSHDAAEALINLYAAGNRERRRELKRYGLTASGHPAAVSAIADRPGPC